MKLIHLSDLHIGKKVNEFSFAEDRKYIFKQILNIIEKEKTDGVIIAGDVYDKSTPSAEAVQAFDDFLYSLTKLEQKVFVISGNHDSPERIAFGSRLISESGVYLSPVYSGDVKPVVLEDSFGEINIYMLPFVKPANVRRFFEDEEINSYTDAVKTAVDNMNVNSEKRNLIITHQFVTGASKCESEDISVGGTDNVDVSVFKNFDYVALGHIHNPQSVSRETVRYCGTPLKYSFSETNVEKSVTIVEFFKKGNVSVSTIPLVPKRDMQELKGSYMELTAKSFYGDINTDNYFHIILTDEEDIIDAVGKLRVIYPNLMKLDYDNTRTRTNNVVNNIEKLEQKSPLDLFSDLFEMQNNQKMSDTQRDFSQNLIEKIWEAEQCDQ